MILGLLPLPFLVLQPRAILMNLSLTSGDVAAIHRRGFGDVAKNARHRMFARQHQVLLRCAISPRRGATLTLSLGRCDFRDSCAALRFRGFQGLQRHPRRVRRNLKFDLNPSRDSFIKKVLE